MDAFEFNHEDLVSCIESIINVDIGICNLYHSDYEDEYKNEFIALANGTNDKLLDVICNILINRHCFEAEIIKRNRGVVKTLSSFFAKIHLGVYDQSKSIIDTWDKSIYILD